MSDRQDLAARLLSQVRDGEMTVVDRLLQCYREELRESALQRTHADPRTVDEALQRTYSRASHELVRFSGDTHELAEWLEEQLQQTLNELSGATIQLPGSHSTVSEPDPAKAAPGQSSATAPDSDDTLHHSPSAARNEDTCEPAGDVTLHRPLEPTLEHGSDPQKDAAQEDSAFAGAVTVRSDSQGPIQADATTLSPGAGRPKPNGGAAKPPSEPPPEVKQFGEYELLDTIARGGMGVVYKARQRKLNRVVAVKMILAGQFADELDVDRFYAEAEAAANLRHPNIVTVYEVGECEGQHYFSMDYIDGKSLAELVRENPLPPQASAEYTRTVADAMQYAHNQGILHRDLKPSNILLDRSQVPLVTDFGLAKRVEGQSALTMSGAILGTPSYMPPEQAAGDGENVTVCSDVYSLGAILYELITGSPPFRAANPFETIKQVLEKEPVAPRLLNSSVPVDLETICLKCLQKDPHSRYQSAQELSDELTRFLNGEPILARPVPAHERFIRLCRRNPRIATLSGLLVLAFFGIMASLAWGYFTSQAALAQAEVRLKQARHSVDELFVKVSENELLNKPGLQSLRKDLLLKARDLYQEILEDQPDDPTSRDDLARSYFRLGSILEKVDSPSEALQSYSRAIEMQQKLVDEQPDNQQLLFDIGNTWNNIGTTAQRLDRPDQAFRAFENAVTYRQRLVDRSPDNAEYVRKLANTQMNLGIFEKERGDYAASEKRFRSAQNLREKYLDEDADASLFRDQVENYFNLANLALEVRDLAATQGAKEQHDAQNRLQSTLGDYEKAIATFQTATADETANLQHQHFLGVCHFLSGDLRVAVGDVDGALTQYREARTLLERLCRENPDVVEYRESLAKLLINLAGLQLMASSDQPAQHSGMQFLLSHVHGLVRRASERLERMRTSDLAAETYREAQVILDDLLKRYPDYADYQAHQAALMRGIANQQWNDGDLEAARQSYQQACKQLDELIAKYPEHIKYKLECAQARGSAARLAVDLSAESPTDEQALKLLNEAQLELAALIKEYPRDRFYAGHLASAHYERAMVSWRIGSPDAAESDLAEAVKYFHQLAEEYGEQEYVLNRDRSRGNLAALQLELAAALAATDAFEQAAERVSRAVDELADLVAAYPGVAIFADDHRVALDMLGKLHPRLKGGDLADRILDQLNIKDSSPPPQDDSSDSAAKESSTAAETAVSGT